MRRLLLVLSLACAGCTAILGDFTEGGAGDAGSDALYKGSSPDGASNGGDGAIGSVDAGAFTDGNPDAPISPADADAPTKDAGTVTDASNSRDAADATASLDAATDSAADAGWDAWGLVCTVVWQDSVTPTAVGCVEHTLQGISWSFYCGTQNQVPCDQCGLGVPCYAVSGDPSLPGSSGTTSLP